MSGYWQPADVGLDPDDYPEGQVPVKDDATGRFAPGAGGGTPTPSGSRLVEAATTTADGMLTFRYGIDGEGNPHFNDDGVDLDQAARLFADPTTATFHLEALL